MISVVTPTWARHDLLIHRCMKSVANQTVPVEHVVVSDGPDDVLRRLLEGYDVVYLELDEHPADEVNTGAHARNLGLAEATGDLIAYLDDDNAFRPDHIETLAAALEATPTADFAYSRMFRHWQRDEIGRDPPAHGHIDSSILMHRKGVPEKFGLWPPNIYEVDWALVREWVANGATWVHVSKVTVDYYQT